MIYYKNMIMNRYMKLLLQKFVFAIITFVFLFSNVSCEDVNSIHQKYYDEGEDIYTGVVDSLKAYVGFEKVRFEWELSADPRITNVVVYWNQRADSVVIDVLRKQSGRLLMTHDLITEEGNYIYEFITKDDFGHFSLPVESVVEVLGGFYVESLRSRGVTSIEKKIDGSMLIKWDAIASKEIQYVTIKYKVNGKERSIRVENDKEETILDEVNTGDVINIITTYLPENAFEEFNSLPKEYIMPKLEREINKGNFSIVALAGDNISVQSNNRDLSRIWDGGLRDPQILHTKVNDENFKFPHFFTFDMGVLAEISRFRLWPRTDVGAFTGHSPRHFEIWGSDKLHSDMDDENYWMSDKWMSDWKLIGNHEIIKPSDSESQKNEWAAGWEYLVNENIERIRYIRIIVKTNWGSDNCVNIGEITLWGDDL